MSRSMQNLLREFRTLYEERLQRLELSPNAKSLQNVKAKCEVFQHYVHDLLEQNDALINALKDSEVKLETSGELERSLVDEIGLAKGFEEQLFVAREEKSALEVDIEELQLQANSLRQQLDESDATRDRLEAAVGDAHRDVAKMRVEMNDLREKMRLNDRTAQHSDEDMSRIQHELQTEQSENAKLTSCRDAHERKIEMMKSDRNAHAARITNLESELNDKSIELASMERELISYRIGRNTGVEKEHQEKTQKIILAAKITELEKELRPLREEINTKSDKLSREKDLSFELASSVARLKDQVKIQMENYKTLESQSKDTARKLKEAKDEVESLDRRRSTLTTENQKLRELLHEAQIDRTKLKDDRTALDSDAETAQRMFKEKVRHLEGKLERRTREGGELADRITKLNGTISTLRASEKSLKVQNGEMTNDIIDLKRKMTDFITDGKNKDDKITLLDTQLHDRDVELDTLRSSINNKAAESEEHLAQISKQEQLVHELSTELSSRNCEIRRMVKSHEDLQADIVAFEEKVQHQTLKIQTQDEVIIIARGEIDEYERMKPHPESEVHNLQSQLDQISMENESMRIKQTECNRRITDTSHLCNELRNKLKSAVHQRDQSQQLANLYETKFSAAERQLKELEYTVHKTKSEVEREKECSTTRQDAFQQRIKDIESARNTAEDICQTMQREVGACRADNEKMVKSLEKELEKVHLVEKELQLQGNENERLAIRVNEQRTETIKLSKLVEELTSNCEQLQRQKRESDGLLRNIRGELGMSNKARKATEQQLENYRTSIRQLDETSAVKTAELERLTEQLRTKQTDEINLKTKKRGLKATLTEVEDTKRNLEQELVQTQRIGQEQKSRIKSLEDALRMIRRETETSHGRLKHDKEKIKKQCDNQTSEFVRKTAEYESRSTRQQGEICRLADVIEKLQAELSTSKVQLSQTQRLEHQSRADSITIREATKNRDDRMRDLQSEFDALQRENSRQMGEMARHIKEKEMAMMEEEKLRGYSLKQQTLVQELRRKLAAKTKLQVQYQPQMYGDFASTQ